MARPSLNGIGCMQTSSPSPAASQSRAVSTAKTPFMAAARPVEMPRISA